MAVKKGWRMDNKINRRDFLKTGLRFAVTSVAITACGDLIAMGEDRKKIGEITVGEDNFIIGVDVLKENKAVNFIFKGKKSILVYNDGKIKAFENICTHKGGPTKLQDDKMICQWHGAVFDPLTGRALKGPALLDSKLPAINLREQDEKIYVDV
jgi:nitrite reductase/ring-hydroxylating ferredoxin subunit